MFSGSSWNAFKVVDKVMLGGESPSSLSHQKTSPIDFEFGCQESETGLFRTQYVDGIMGLSARSDTFPYQLHSQRATATKAFSICFKNGGGSLTLGGVDPDIMKQESLTNPLNFTPLLKKNGGQLLRTAYMCMYSRLHSYTCVCCVGCRVFCAISSLEFFQLLRFRSRVLLVII